jgi:hypothetical protein
LPAVVLTRQHHVVEVDGGLSDGRNVYDPRRGAATQRGKQQVRQQKRREIVDRKPELMTVAADLSAIAWRTEADAGIVNQDVETIVCGCNVVRQTPHVIERRKIGAIVLDV